MTVTKHAIFSASKAHRWMNCPGSIKAEAQYQDTSSKWAEEGTIAHELASACLHKNKWTCADTYIEEFLKYIAKFKTSESIIWVEEKVEYPHLAKGGFGTVDCGMATEGTLDIFDLKYGKGVLVTDDTQLRFYASALVAEIETSFCSDSIEKIRLHIVQPRLDNILTTELSIKELKKWETLAKKRVKIASGKNPKRIPGTDQCRFCTARADCKERADFVTDVITADFNDETKLTDKRRRAILDNKGLIMSLIRDVEETVYNRLLHGNEFAGYKLIMGRSTRVWKPQAEKRLKKLLGGDAYTKKLIGITDAEKRIGSNEMSKITIKPPGRLTLASESSPKTGVSSIDAFDIEE